MSWLAVVVYGHDSDYDSVYDQVQVQVHVHVHVEGVAQGAGQPMGDFDKTTSSMWIVRASSI